MVTSLIGESSWEILFSLPTIFSHLLMPKAKLKPGVSRRVKYSQTGPQGNVQTTILNQPALVRRREAATKIQLDLLQGALWPVHPPSE